MTGVADDITGSLSSSTAATCSGQSMMRSVRPLSRATATAYCDNTVINSRYTITNFLWRNLCEQFGRPLNAYFLLVVLLQFMSVIAPVNPLSTFLPLAFAFLLTAAKEGYDDYKRHQSDNAQNSRTVYVLRCYYDAAGRSSQQTDEVGGPLGMDSQHPSPSSASPAAEWVLVQSKDLRVGDVVRLTRNDEIPADMVALSCPSDAHGIVYIRTDNMDGEIDLKPRDVVPLATCCGGSTPIETAIAGGREPHYHHEKGNALLRSSSPNNVDAGCASIVSTNPSESADQHQPLVAHLTAANKQHADAVSPISYGHHAMSSATPSSAARRSPSQGHDSHLLFTTKASPRAIVEALRPFVVDVPPPTVAVDRFDARLLMNGEGKSSLSHSHLLPQSCFIKNTAEAICLVVYTGKDTKAALNKSPTPIKWAKIDKDVSQYSKYIFIAQLCCAAVCGVTGHLLSIGVEQKFWYVMPPKHESAFAFIIYPLRFFLLTTVMIPISFKFVVDISKYFMAMTIEWDLNMWDAERGIGAKVRNSSILEDLGQIEYILSDKTGTMTKNEMVLKEVSVYGQRLLLKKTQAGRPYAHAVSPSATEAGVTEEQLAMFWHALAVCNSVEVEVANQSNTECNNNTNSASTANKLLQYSYAAVSPDEEALCVAAAAHGHRLVERTKQFLRVAVADKPAGMVMFSPVTNNPSHGHTNFACDQVSYREFIVQQTFSFASELKCMSVLITDATNRSYLYCKGADDKLLSLLSPSFVASPVGSARITRVAEDLESFAAQGLRTLLVCFREVSSEEVAAFNKAHREAMLEMDGRAERLLALRVGIEKDFELIGATAIEDCLQEGVAQTISDLLDANIKVWMLTGDKIETAEQIALSCGLMAPNDTTIPVFGPQWEEVLKNAANPGAYVRRTGRPIHTPATTPASSVVPSGMTEMRSVRSLSHAVDREEPSDHPFLFGGSGKGTVLIVQGGRVLESILSDPTLSERFVTISSKCKAVVCARVTPIQKAQVTAMVRRQGKLTLAIGDGGNDVAMIQEAHVGVGIVGREGKQAALASDFSFTKFRFLSALLFYHGHQSYNRTAFVVQYSFYKSMLIAFIQILFNIWVTYMSGGSFWDSLSLTAWNGLYTLPQTIFFVFDRVAPRAVLEQNPFLYRLPQRNYAMTRSTFFGHIAKGAVQSCFALWLVYNVTAAPFVASEAGCPETASVTFLTVYSAFMWLQVFTVIIESNAVGIFNAIAIVGMPLAYYLISEEFYDIPTVTASGGFRHSMTLPLHLTNLLITFTLFAPHLLYYVVQKVFYPTALDVLRHDEVSRLSQRGYIVSTARTTAFTTKGIVAKLLLAGEIIARSFVIVEEPGEELAFQMEKAKESKKRARANSSLAVSHSNMPLGDEVLSVPGSGVPLSAPSSSASPAPILNPQRSPSAIAVIYRSSGAGDGVEPASGGMRSRSSCVPPSSSVAPPGPSESAQ